MNTEQTLVSMGNQNSTNTDMIQDEINQDDKIRIPYRNRFQHTPTDILKSNLENCPANREPLLFLTVGSLCPVHVQHVQIQEIAKRHLEVYYIFQSLISF